MSYPANQHSQNVAVPQRPKGDCGCSTKSNQPSPKASGEAARPGAEAPLGNKRKNVGSQSGGKSSLAQQAKAKAAAKKKRIRQLMRELAADQRTAASIYRNMVPEGEKAAGRGVCLCGWTKIAGKTVELYRAESKDGARAFYKGLAKCGLRWVCPLCTRAASEKARETLNDALAAAREHGFVPVLITLTARHHAGMSLADFWDRLSTAEKQLKDVQGWRRMKALNGPMVGFAKAIEATHGRNGWHPHFHLLMVMRADSEAEAIEAVQWIREAWLEQLEGVGLDGRSPAALRRAFDVQGAAEAGSYVTKWGAAEELALSNAKTGRSGGRTPWQLLRDARTAEVEQDRRRAAALWWEFVQVFKGAHQVRLSPSLKALVADYREDHPPAEDEDRPEVQPVFGFSDLEWEVGRWRRTMMREAVEDVPVDQAREAVLAALLSDRCDRDDLLPIEEDPGALVEDDNLSYSSSTPRRVLAPHKVYVDPDGTNWSPDLAHDSHLSPHQPQSGDDAAAQPSNGGGYGPALHPRRLHRDDLAQHSSQGSVGEVQKDAPPPFRPVVNLCPEGQHRCEEQSTCRHMADRGT